MRNIDQPTTEPIRGAGKPFKSKANAWDLAVPLVGALSPRRQAMMFRYCVAQTFNLHQPQGVQVVSRRMCKGAIADLCEHLGLDINDRGRGLDHDQEWQRAVAQVVLLTGEDQWRLARSLAENHPNTAGLSRQGLLAFHWKISRLSLLLGDLMVQQRANDAGWVLGLGYVKSKASRKRRT